MSLPHTSHSDFLPVILDRDDEENQQGDALDACQEEEVVVQLAVIDVTYETHKDVRLDSAA